MHKNSSRLALLAGLAAMTVPTSAFAIGTTAFETEPAQPVPGQPFTIVAQPNNVTGAVTYAWDLDMDGVCETAPSANPS